MKILLQNSLWWPQVIGGAEISTHLLGVELRRRGHGADAVAATGFCGRGGLVSRPTEDKLGTVYEGPGHGLIDLLAEGDAPSPGILKSILKKGLHHFIAVSSPRWERLFSEAIVQSRPQIVHTNTLVGLTPSIWAAARRHKVPVVHTIRDYHLLCPRTTLLRSNGTDCRNPPLPCRILATLKMKRTHDVNMVTAPTRFVLQKHLDQGGFPGAEAHVIPNALEELPTNIPQRAAQNPVQGLFLGQIDSHKGIPELVQALRELLVNRLGSCLHFSFAGHGPLVPMVTELSAEYPQQIRYHGMVRGDEKRQLLATSDFMVVPSVWAEPFSRSIIDAFSWGLPAIGANRGGIPEVITHESDGLVIDPTAPQLVRAMEKLISDHDLRLKLGRKARERSTVFTLKKQADRFIALYEKLAGGSA